MIRVKFVSKETNDLGFVIDDVQFPTKPNLGDFIDIKYFLDNQYSDELIEYLKKEQKIKLAHVNGLTWSSDESGVFLFVSLGFEDEKKPGLPLDVVATML